MEFWWTGFVVGLAGSFHCVGMCGPIAMALPGGFASSLGWVSSRLLYNLGRIITYAFLGLLFGGLGQVISLAGWQQGVSIGLGVLLLIFGLFSIKAESKFLTLPVINTMNLKVKNGLGKLLRNGSHPSLLTIGLLNGFLPCGFVYVGLFGAVTSGTLTDGMLYMTFFGLGTVPLMLATSLAGAFISVKARNVFKKLVPVFLVLFAALFIARGLNLGIPYLSPEIGESGMSCH